jgi:hypothetical protein
MVGNERKFNKTMLTFFPLRNLSYAVRATKTITITVARDISILLTPFASA